MWCPECEFLQPKHSYDPREVYSDHYGYRSGLSQSMVDHLGEKVPRLEKLVESAPEDIILDIGSNDVTLPKSYSARAIGHVRIDPVEKFARLFPDGIKFVREFFSADAYRSSEKKPGRIVTSIAMHYDLESPVEFAREIESILASDGVWHFEQSYMRSMLRLSSYDTICHEHLEYYSVGIVERILVAAGLKMVEVIMNSVNGGSFAVTPAKRSNTSIAPNRAIID